MEIKFSKSDLIVETKNTLTEEYELLKTLGAGAFSQVYLAKHKASGELRCVKKICKANFSKDQTESVLNEIKILKEIDHPNIMKIYTYHLSERYIFIVMEYFKGEELFTRIERVEKFTEAKAKNVMKTLLYGVSYLHKKNIVHRDLKPENLMYESKEEDANLKIIDFGTSKKVMDNESMKVLMGTVYYVAPEVIAKKYGKECDLWSCGVILYVILSGYPPFHKSNDTATFEMIQTAKFEFPPTEWRTISDSAKDLITNLLKKNPAERLTADQALNHPWFSSNDNGSGLSLNKFLKFRKLTVLQNTMGMFFVNFFGINEQKKELDAAFKKADVDNSGTLSPEECIKIFNNIEGWRPDESHAWLLAIDLNGSNSIDYSEFLVACLDFRKEMNKKQAKKVFDSFDKDKNGEITPEELLNFLRDIPEFDYEKAKKLVDIADVNKDGQVSFDEFVDAVNKVFSN